MYCNPTDHYISYDSGVTYIYKFLKMGMKKKIFEWLMTYVLLMDY